MSERPSPWSKTEHDGPRRPQQSGFDGRRGFEADWGRGMSNASAPSRVSNPNIGSAVTGGGVFGRGGGSVRPFGGSLGRGRAYAEPDPTRIPGLGTDDDDETGMRNMKKSLIDRIFWPFMNHAKALSSC